MNFARIAQQQAAKKSVQLAEEQAQKAAAAEGKRKKKAGFWGNIGGTLLGAAAVGLTGLTGGLAAPLIMGAASSLGKKWADEASKGASPFGKALKTPGQTGVQTSKYGFSGEKEIKGRTDRLIKESKEASKWTPQSMLEDVAMSYVSAGLGGDLKGGFKTLKSDGFAKSLGGAQGSVGGLTGFKQALGLEKLGTDPTFDYKSLEGTMSPSEYDALVSTAQEGFTDQSIEDLLGEGWDAVSSDPIDYSGETFENISNINPSTPTVNPPFADNTSTGNWWEYKHGGEVPKMDQNTLIGLTILSQLGNVKNTKKDKSDQPTISEYFSSKGKTLGGNDIQSLSQKLGL